VLVQVIVQPVRPGVHHRLEPARRARVDLFERIRIVDQPIPQIAINRAFSLRLGRASQRIEVVGLDAIEVVFRLGVKETKYRIGVGFSRDVRNSPVVAGDGNVLRLAGPSGEVSRGRGRRSRGLRGGGGGSERGAKEEKNEFTEVFDHQVRIAARWFLANRDWP
jgi:hypothetical protein